MFPASHLPGSRNAHTRLARVYGFSRVSAFLPVLLSLFAPATAWGDIYKWTDERGNLVISNVQPVPSANVSDVELLATAAQSPATSSQQAATPTEQALAARIENLERQLQPQQYAPLPQSIPQPGYSEGYYPASIPPPPESGYYGSYDPGYYPDYSSGYYPSFFNPWPVSYSFITIPARSFARRPPFVTRPPGSMGRPPGPVGRPPTFAGRPPTFVGQPPMFAGRPVAFGGSPPAFASRPVSGVSHSASVGGGSMHSGRR